MATCSRSARPDASSAHFSSALLSEAITALLYGADTSRTTRVVIRGARVFDAEAAQMVDADVILEGNRIVSVGKGEAPAGAEIVVKVRALRRVAGALHDWTPAD